MDIEHWDVSRDGPLSEQAMRSKLESRGFQVTRYIYSPGTVFPDHMHEVDKIDGVLSGRFRMQTGDRTIILVAGDILAVPHGTIHSAEVVGNDPVISLDAVRI